MSKHSAHSPGTYDSIIWPLKLNNPFSGRVVNYPDLGDQTSVYRCLTCNQPVNARDLGQVFHHETHGHRPIPPQLVCSSESP